MASVQMSQILRELILDNYEKQLRNAMAKEYKMDKAIIEVQQKSAEDLDFVKIVQMDSEYRKLAERLNNKYRDPKRYSYSNVARESMLELNTTLGLVCNPNRPKEENLTYLSGYEAPYTHTDYSGKEITEKGSDSYVEGDIAVKLTDLEPFYAIKPTDMNYTNWRGNCYGPNSHSCLVVTDPELCKVFSPIGEFESSVETTLETFKNWLETVTTLKKFLDEVSGGIDLVPQEYKDRLNKKPVKKAVSTPLPVDAMPDSLKKQLNEVILENKLMGD